MKPFLFAALLTGAVVGAAVLRLARLDNRPMHCDEANQAVKFGILLEQGDYRYNPHEHHGPALNYLTLPVAWAASARKITQVTETQLRLVPALAGILLVGLVWLVREDLGCMAAIAAALLAALSPAMVFYSRYYIMEMLLVTFTFAAMVAWWRFRRVKYKAATVGRAEKEDAPATPGSGATNGRITDAAPATPSSDSGATNGRITDAAPATPSSDSGATDGRITDAAPATPSSGSGATDGRITDAAPATPSSGSGATNGRITDAAPATPSSGSGATDGRGFMGVPWLILLGVSIGMMHASKETCILALLAMAVAAVAVDMPEIWRTGLRRVPLVRLGVAASIAGLTAAAVSAAFFSSFGSNPGGVIDSYAAFLNYAGRASGEGSAGPQVQPWDYYFRVLFASGRPGGAAFNEVAIAVLAMVGLTAAVVGKPLKPEHRPAARFLAVYTLLLTAIYTAMPYKTPWSAMGFFHGMILLAGVGAAALLHAAPWRWLKAAVVVGLLISAVHLTWQAYQTNFVFQENPANPYAHTPTHRTALRLCEKVRDISTVHPDGRAMYVQVICPDKDYWPLPWYLRDMPRIHWLEEVPEGPAAPLIITRPELVAEVVKHLYEDQPPGHRYLTVPLPPQRGADWLLRPGVPLEVFIRHELLEKYRSAAPAEKPPPQTP